MVCTTVLVLEDDVRAVERLQAHLSRHDFEAVLIVANRLEAFRRHLIEQQIDIVLAAYSRQSHTGFDVIDLVKQVCPEIPCILLSGVPGEERAVEALQRGAMDYVLKQRMERLVPALKRALEEKQLRLQLRQATEALQQSEAQFRTAVETMQNCFAILKPQLTPEGAVNDLVFDYFNPAALSYLGFSHPPVGATLLSVIPLLRPLQIFEHLCQISRYPMQFLQEKVRLQGLVRPPQGPSADVQTFPEMSSGHSELLNQQYIALDIRAVSLQGDRIVMTWCDITQQQQHIHQQAQTIQQFQARYRDLLRTSQGLLASLSQKLQVAIADIEGCNQLLQLEQLSTAQQQQVLHQLEHCNKHLTKLLETQQAIVLTAQPATREAPSADSEQKQTKQGDAIQLTGLKILIIDDIEDACEVAKLALEIYGAETVEICQSAAQGMAKLVNYQPDVLIVDIQMPQQDGYSFIRQLRNLEDQRLSLIPAIACTADALATDQRKAILAGFQLHLAKPIDIQRLAEAVYAVAIHNRHPNHPSLGRESPVLSPNDTRDPQEQSLISPSPSPQPLPKDRGWGEGGYI